MDTKPKQEQPHFEHPQSQSSQPANGQVFSTSRNLDDVNASLDALETQVNQPPRRINLNTDIIGLFETVTTIPTGVPINPYQQVKLYSNGSIYRLYWYDATNHVWQYTRVESSPQQFAQTADYTANATVTITTGFTPREVRFNGYVFNSSGNKIYGTTTGFAGVTAPSTGYNNYFTIQDVTGTVVIGTGTNLGGNSVAFCSVTSWTTTGIVLTVVVPTNWTLSTNIMIS